MLFTTFLRKYFDIEVTSEFRTDVKCSNDPGKDVDVIFVYEKDNDCEPLFILRDAWWFTDTKEKDHWILGNIYSSLENGKEYSEDELKKIIKKGSYL